MAAMTVETLIGNLSRAEQLLAMELIWQSLSSVESTLESPGWHDEVVRERLQNPLPGGSLGLRESLAEIQGRRSARQTST